MLAPDMDPHIQVAVAEALKGVSGGEFSWFSPQDLAPAVDPHMQAAIAEALKGVSEGGIPIGSVLVSNSSTGGEVLARGHNKRVQESNPILHAEMDCLTNAGRIGSTRYRHATLYSTLMPCYMCAGTIVQFKIPKVVVGESRNFSGTREFMESHGVQVVDLDLPECIDMMSKFITDKPELWNEDIGE